MIGDKKYTSSYYKKGIEAIESCSRIWNAAFEISYKGKNKNYTSPYLGKWKIKVYGQIFSDVDFIKAAGKAVEFVYKANESLRVSINRKACNCDHWLERGLCDGGCVETIKK